MTTPTTEEAVERLRKAVGSTLEFDSDDVETILSELSTLQARARSLETEVLDAALSDRLDEAGSPLTWKEVAEALQARVERAEGERDEALAALTREGEAYEDALEREDDWAVVADGATARALAAEVKVGRLLAAISLAGRAMAATPLTKQQDRLLGDLFKAAEAAAQALAEDTHD